jgi:hypothetical protein
MNYDDDIQYKKRQRNDTSSDHQTSMIRLIDKITYYSLLIDNIQYFWVWEMNGFDRWSATEKLTGKRQYVWMFKFQISQAVL